MSLRALCFDFDGVLADTENIHVAAWERTLADLGWEVPDAVCARAAEEDDRDFLTSLFESQQIDRADVMGWIRRKQELTLALLRDSPRVYPGVAALVHAVRGKLKLAVVTGTWRANVQAVLEAAGLAGAFDVVVAKEDVAAAKPAPDAYHRALKQLAVAPSQAVALEDSPTGVAAALAAGLGVLAVGHRRPQGDWVGSAVYITRLVPTERVLAALGIDLTSGA
jgi:HAD superfamily hydrolase (TIGR01509 family)